MDYPNMLLAEHKEQLKTLKRKNVVLSIAAALEAIALVGILAFFNWQQDQQAVIQAAKQVAEEKANSTTNSDKMTFSEWSNQKYGFDITQENIVAGNDFTADYMQEVLNKNGNTTTKVLVERPASGEVLSGDIGSGSEIIVTADSECDYVVSLKSIHGDERLTFFVRAGDTVTMGVPAEYLYVYFASGTDWYGYGKGRMFGADTVYSKDDELLDFRDGAWEYTLYPVTNGNFSETPSSADEFF